jgi:hypothetical protein
MNQQEDIISATVNNFISIADKDKDGYYRELIDEEDFNDLKKAIKQLITSAILTERKRVVNLFKRLERKYEME